MNTLVRNIGGEIEINHHTIEGAVVENIGCIEPGKPVNVLLSIPVDTLVIQHSAGYDNAIDRMLKRTEGGV